MRDLVETVRFSADIVRIISDYVALRGTGNALKALCPFHPEKTPSFSVHREKQIFHCFGCGVGGDVFKFVMMAERVTFPEALRIVAGKCGVAIPDEPPVRDETAKTRRWLFELHERATDYFERKLSSGEGKLARQVLEARQIRSQYVKLFRLGYASSSGLAAALGPKDPAANGLFLKNDRGEVYDRFRRRLMFPIANERGQIIAFGGRIIGEGEPKYLNSPESVLYSKSFVLYGLHRARESARRSGRIVVVEGYFDCLSLHQNGIENVVASCGTSLTPQQVTVLARCAPEVIMNYDPDSAGQNAMRRSLELLLARGLRPRILKLAEGLDPDEFVRRQGGPAYSRLLERAPYFWQHLISEAGHRFDLAQPEAKARAVHEILYYVARIQDRVEQFEVAGTVAEVFKLPEHLVREQLGLASKGAGALASRLASSSGTDRKLTLAEKQLIQALFDAPGVASSLAGFLEGDFLAEIWSGPVIERLLREPSPDVEKVLAGIDDRQLQSEVRGAMLEPFGRISTEVAVASIKQLYQEYLLKKERVIREELKKYGAVAAPAELIRRQMDIVAEKSRLKSIKP